MLYVLIDTLKEEEKSLRKLLGLLDEQYKFIMANDVFKLEDVVGKIKLCNKEVAEYEVKRRNSLNGYSMKDVILKSKNVELENKYRDIKKLLHEVILQKETNELLIKQQLSMTNRLLSIINPNREVKTYNSIGGFKR
ncbi:flagellar protein FlgN [Clostridium fallax]|uniref:FlgN protein n=1 Tax=Clostridium fallax TaxID=1533 RepID=A0A1M4UMB0_9CLOT|nr:flagellar protein FlgN [Clostridium fallax]SHE57787.1 FlgN protein [Clostridium fallax]SQB07640.1 FlgN protein [Clostridium fallax]